MKMIYRGYFHNIKRGGLKYLYDNIRDMFKTDRHHKNNNSDIVVIEGTPVNKNLSSVFKILQKYKIF